MLNLRWLFCFSVCLAFTAPTWAAEKAAAPKKAVKPAAAKPAKTTAKAAKAPAKPAVKTAAKAAPKKGAKVLAKAPAPATTANVVKTSLKRSPGPAPAPVLRGKTEVLTCRDGTEDRHARIALVLVGGKTDGFAYYSKWKPRTCSIYLQRNRDPHSKWSDSGSVTNVSLERGLFTIEHHKNEYRLLFRDVDRERYCGMDGTINGTLTIRKGSERCEVAGIMEEGVPLGQAVAYMEMEQNAQQAAAAASAPAQAAPARPRHALEPPRRDPASPFPPAAVGLSD